MPPKRKVAPVEASPYPPRKRSRKITGASPASPGSPSPHRKVRTSGRNALPSKPPGPSQATNERAAPPTKRQTRSSSPMAPPAAKAVSRTTRVTRSSSSVPTFSTSPSTSAVATSYPQPPEMVIEGVSEVDNDEEAAVLEPDTKSLWGKIRKLNDQKIEGRKEAKAATKKADNAVAAEQALATKGNKLVARITELEDKLQEAEEKLEKAEGRIDIGVEELREADRELHECKERLGGVEAKLEQALQELRNVDGLADELMKTKRELGLAKGNLQKVRRSEKEATHLAVSKQKDIDHNLKEIRELEAKLEEMSKSLDKVNSGLSEAKNEAEKCRNRSEHFEEAASGHLKTKKDLEKMVKALTAEVVKTRGATKMVGRRGRIDFGVDWE